MRNLVTPVILIACLAGAAAAGEPARTPFGVADSIGLSSFIPSGEEHILATPRILPSPDGTRFLAATVRGDLDSGRRVATLWTLDASALRAFLRKEAPDFGGAQAIARWGTLSNQPPITNWRWTSDSDGVLFLGADDQGLRRLYRATEAARGPEALTPAEQDVTAYDEQAGVVAWLSHEGVSSADTLHAGGSAIPDIVSGRGQGLPPLLFPLAMDQLLGRWTDTLWILRDGVADAARDEDGREIRLRGSRLVLSPDGRTAITTPYAAHVPKAWEKYVVPSGLASLAFVADADDGRKVDDQDFRARQYMAVDLETGRSTPVLDAPIAGEAAWYALGAEAGPGGRVAVVGAYTPVDAPPQDDALLACRLAVVEAPGRAWTCLQRMSPRQPDGPPYGDRPQITALTWGLDGRSLRVREATPNAPDDTLETLYVQTDGRWRAAPADGPTTGLRLRAAEAYDRPPVLTAALDGQEPRTVLDPNPQLASLALGAITPYSWPIPAGGSWTGALVKPADFRPGRRYPLIIQTHGLDRAHYLADGPSATGYAAQALASRGFLVLQVQEGAQGFGTEEENGIAAEAYIAAVRQLDAEGLVDPARVGISAWSHFGPHAMQALLRRPDMFAASVFAEASYTSYPVYLNNIDYMGPAREDLYRRSIGPRPFGDGLRAWLDRAEGFQLDRLCTPALIQINSPIALAYGWASYAALAAQGKPVDLLYIRNGAHALVQPRQRLAAQTQVVDWYDYWINGARSSDPAKADQYALWDRLREGDACRTNPE